MEINVSGRVWACVPYQLLLGNRTIWLHKIVRARVAAASYSVDGWLYSLILRGGYAMQCRSEYISNTRCTLINKLHHKIKDNNILILGVNYGHQN